MKATRNRVLKCVALLYGVATMLYLIAFILVFDIFGCPSRTSHHWIGPTPRHCDGALDIGEVYEWGEEGEAPISQSYAIFRPLCVTWLVFNGLEAQMAEQSSPLVRLSRVGKQM